jgi:hypothetical protein
MMEWIPYTNMAERDNIARNGHDGVRDSIEMNAVKTGWRGEEILIRIDRYDSV